MDYVEIKINRAKAGKTIKEILKDDFHIGRGKVEELRNSKSVFINNELSNIETIVRQGDILRFLLDEEIDFIKDDGHLEVVYEDDYLLVCNKEAGIIIHPDDKSKGGTLVNLVASYYADHNINRKVRFINRLDKDTTGLVLFAKDFLSEAKLHFDIESHQIKRDYLAICLNRFSSLNGIINAPLGGDRHNSNKQVVTSKGKRAVTHYEVKKIMGKKESLVELHLETGRTHQIRVHLAHINHPVKGDKLYGNGGERLYLHGFRLSLYHPISGEFLVVESSPDFIN